MGNLKRRAPLEDQGIDGRIILSSMLEKQVGPRREW
jgi:hypothetical protein